MIKLTRLNDSLFIVNADLIEIIEANPDTIVTLTTGRKLLVKESMEDIINRVKDYKQSVLQRPLSSDNSEKYKKE